MNHEESEDRTPEGTQITELILTVFRTNGRLLRAGDSFSKDLGLTSARWQVLGAIEHSPKTVAQIARDYEQTRQGILWVVQSLVKDELVELVHNPDHRRAKLVRLTAKGSGTWDKIIRRQKAWSNGLGEGFTARELAATVHVMRRLSEAIKKGQDEDED